MGNQSCATARCSLEHGGVEYCVQCAEYPCGQYKQEDAFDSLLTHRNRRRDLERIMAMGATGYQQELLEKRKILQWLLERWNDGRHKGFFCLAVNLLPLETVRSVAGKLEREAGQDLPEREKAIRAAALLQAEADRQGICLKLRRKQGKKKN
ncbi:DUF3795 domain-containing protein [Oscillibacter sp. PC13]|uniref:DUF3795 domain-containing protein n=1 Tax=Oscillibacter sp. PC13 TaxID=1855299 RepID=UPI00325AA852